MLAGTAAHLLVLPQHPHDGLVLLQVAGGRAGGVGVHVVHRRGRQPSVLQSLLNATADTVAWVGGREGDGKGGGEREGDGVSG